MVTKEQIKQARERIAPYVEPTPSRTYGVTYKGDGYWDAIPETGYGGLLLKMENMHDKVGAFKIRGVCNKLLSLDGQVDKIVTAAIGSHGFALGHMCKQFNKKSICYMPSNAPRERKRKMEELVDYVLFVDGDFTETEQEARKYAEKHDLTFIHPYNDEDVIAGQGTIGLEIEQEGYVDNIYVPVGGGGLISGIATAVNENTRIIGVQPWQMSAMVESVRNKKPTTVKQGSSLAEPLCVNPVKDSITFEYMQLIDEFITPTERQIREAMKGIYKYMGDMVEGAGAIALAAALDDENRRGTSVCIVSGGNISEERFRETTH